MNTRTQSTTAVEVGSRADARIAAAFACILGIGLVFMTGFAHPMAIHNAAHDTRHALSFPCH